MTLYKSFFVSVFFLFLNLLSPSLFSKVHFYNKHEKSLNEQIYKLFPYSSPKFNSQDALAEIKKSIKIIDTRLSNSAELDKSIKNLESGVSKLNWNEFKKLSYDYISELD